jgi:predicted transglutaminase-like cysteine proteinase
VRRSVIGLVAGLILGLVGAVPNAAHAADGLVPLANRLRAGHVVAPTPPGFVSFCLRFPGQCATDMKEPKRLALTAALWDRIEEVNREVNQEIRPMDDLQHYGRPEYWNIPTDGKGDCEDYALAKRKLLIAAGLPARALRLAVVKWNGEGHAVLTVATDHGDYVLDNLIQIVRSWDNTGYEWIERQDPDRTWGWVALGPLPAPAMATSAAGRARG